MASARVKISCVFAITEPGNISLSNPDLGKSLKLVATVRQESSPLPDRPVTILTTGSILAIGGPKDANAFSQKMITSPTDVSNKDNVIRMYVWRCRVTRYPLGGVLDMHQRRDHQFITIPPVGQGSVELAWSLAPDDLLYYYPHEGSIEERLKRFTPGQRFKIEPDGNTRVWWTWGSLQDSLRDKKFSCWSLPNNLPIVREEGQYEGDEIDRNLVDIVDRRDLGMIIRQWNLPGTPDPGDYVPPNVKEMKAHGWVFGEPVVGLDMEVTKTVTFGFVE